MPSQVTVSMTFQDPSGKPLAGGRVSLRLQQDISAGMANGPQVAAGRPIQGMLDTNGSVLLNLWATVGMQPQSVYFVEAFSSLGQPVWKGEVTVSDESNFILLEDGTDIWLESGAPDGILMEGVATPMFDPPAGTYISSQSVTISSTPGASIYYTTDGSTPSLSNGTLVTGPVTVSTSETLKAIAYAVGFPASSVGSASYTLEQPTPSISPNGAVFTSSQVVTLSSAGSPDAIYYTVDGSTPTHLSLVYSGPITVSSTTTVKAIGVKTGWSDSAVATASFVKSATVGFLPVNRVFTGVTGPQSISAPAVNSTGVNFLVAILDISSVPLNPISVTDNFGNVWRALDGNPYFPASPSTTNYLQLFYTYDATNGPGHVVTATTTIGGVVDGTYPYMTLEVFGFIGIQSSSDPFVSQAVSTITSGTSIQPGSVSTDVGDLAFATLGLTGFGDDSSVTVDSGFTQFGLGVDELTAYLVTPSGTTTLNPTFSWTPFSQYTGCNIAVFKHA